MNKLNNHTDLGDVLIRSDLNVPMINNEITDKGFDILINYVSKLNI